MIKDVVIEPMTEEFIVWRCLHGGPLSGDTIDQWPVNDKMPWKRLRDRNLPLLRKLTRTYGACAIIARDSDQIVGQLRFYPKVIFDMIGSEGFCLQQDYPAGPAEDFINSDFPVLADIEDKTLMVHCLMTGSPQQKENPYQRKGLGTRLVKTLMQWGRSNGWEAIETNAFEDLPIIYEITGGAGHTFWEKLGFSLIDRHPHPHLQNRDPFVLTLEEQAKKAGIPPEKACDQLVMRFDLT
jgi:hypothetical protein